MNDLMKHIGLRIQEAVEEKNWAAVEHWAKELLKYAPQKTLGFKWLARASLALNKLDRAAYAYNRVLDFESDNEEAKKFFTDYQTSRSIQQSAASEALTPAPDDVFHILAPEMKSVLGRAEFEAAAAYESAKLYADAGERFRKSFYWFQHPQAAYKAAEMFHKCQRSQEALKILRETISANPRWIEGHLLAGQIYFDLGQLSSAQNEWQSALKIDARNEEALNKLRSVWDLNEHT